MACYPVPRPKQVSRSGTLLMKEAWVFAEIPPTPNDPAIVYTANIIL